ncbi:holin family protein [Yoonia sp. F2084L]|uniref:holin family protein n=1 Tax=Yoonia sp. F2084L TaxID=2926419 RepID=UPI001FF0ECD7|nr:holin family protein [Yoonia sp. F2084L]MCK0094727.1 holin family protein [Yoonia sp. F2084L]
MGLISGLMTFLFGDGRNVVAETAQVFRENAENGAVRAASARSDSLAQFAAEFVHPRRGLFDRIVDGLNRLPRPALALGTIWLFVLAMQQPEQFMKGMEGLAIVPEPLWWLMGAIVSFYFGARHQVKSQEFQRSIAMSLAAGQVSPAKPEAASSNPALQDWQVDNAD